MILTQTVSYARAPVVKMDAFAVRTVAFVMTTTVIFVQTSTWAAASSAHYPLSWGPALAQDNVFALRQILRETLTSERIMTRNVVQQDAKLVARKKSSNTVQPAKVINTTSLISQIVG